MLDVILFFGFASAIIRCHVGLSRTFDNVERTKELADAMYASLPKG